MQGSGLRDSAHRFEELDAVILGASFDTPADNLVFAEAQNFPFRLLSDIDRAVGTKYEVARGPDERFPELPKRIAYLIDPEGNIYRRYEVTDTAAHAGDVIADLEAAPSQADI